MKMHALILAIAASFSVSAQTNNPASQFIGDASISLYPCELRVSELAQLEDMYGRAPSDSYAAQTKCLIDGKEQLKAAYTAYLDSKPTAQAAAAAKEFYAANLVWADAISRARNSSHLRQSQEQSDLSKAKAMFRIEAGL